VFTLQTGSAKYGHNSSLWTIAYEVYGTVVVFITRQLCKRYGLRVFLPIFTALYCSEYKDFNAIVLGVFLVEAKLAVKPKLGFIVLTIISFCIVIASHIWDFQNFGTKHVCTPLAAAGCLIGLVRLEGALNEHAPAVSRGISVVVLQAARITFMLYLVHAPFFRLLCDDSLLDYNGMIADSGGNIDANAWKDFAWKGWKYWGVFWPALIVLSIVCTLLVDEPIMRFSNRFRTSATATVAPESPEKDPKSLEKDGHNGMTMMVAENARIVSENANLTQRLASSTADYVALTSRFQKVEFLLARNEDFVTEQACGVFTTAEGPSSPIVPYVTPT